jgi:Diguanylate cyclase, GGDEF domain
MVVPASSDSVLCASPWLITMPAEAALPIGHKVGDAVLAEVAGRVVHAVRCYDKVGRYSGEEFLGVLPDCAGDMLGCIAERIRTRVAAKPILNEGVEIRRLLQVLKQHPPAFIRFGTPP